jgi:hypothetical protein
MAARFSGLRAGRFLPPGRFLVPIFVLEELGELKKIHLIRGLNR